MSIDTSPEKSILTQPIGRRKFLGGSAAAATAAVTLQNFMARPAHALGPIPSPYGAPVLTADMNTGLDLLKLPPGFDYWSFGWTGDPPTDGNTTPGAHDGMAVARQTAGGRRITLIRNHEVGAGTPFASGPLQYSPGAGGGNTNLVWNTQSKLLEQAWASLSGTVRNCAGGVTPWNSWISAEETTLTTVGGTFKHGYCFDIPANGVGKYNSTPIKDMGRFSHEAVCVDPDSYFIYETEDDGDSSGFYRFRSNDTKTSGKPNLQQGGTLEMLKILGTFQADMRPLAAPMSFLTEWVAIPNPDPNLEGGADTCFEQGYAAGGARFDRLEGCWFGLGKVYFVSTTGGPTGEGQVYQYDPLSGKLDLFYHSGGTAECENPDNIVVTPNGAIILCEDNSGGASNPAERLLGLTLTGDIFTFAENNLNFTGTGLGSYFREENGETYTGDFRQNEWAGACFDETGEWLFVNIQTPGVTFAITGPWSAGPL
jgi:hypothetical protein